MDKDSAYWLSCNAQHSLTFVIYLLKHRNPGIALPLLSASAASSHGDLPRR